MAAINTGQTLTTQTWVSPNTTTGGWGVGSSPAGPYVGGTAIYGGPPVYTDQKEPGMQRPRFCVRCGSPMVTRGRGWYYNEQLGVPTMREVEVVCETRRHILAWWIPGFLFSVLLGEHTYVKTSISVRENHDYFREYEAAHIGTGFFDVLFAKIASLRRRKRLYISEDEEE